MNRRGGGGGDNMNRGRVAAEQHLRNVESRPGSMRGGFVCWSCIIFSLTFHRLFAFLQ